MKYLSKLLSFLLIMSLTVSCGEEGVFLFSLQDDVELGRQVSQQIESDQSTYPILPEKGNEAAYAHLRSILNEILKSPEIKYKDVFAYEEIKIIDNDVLNAFATPGGYIYVHRGLIEYLNNDDHLAGVIGHEIAHAEKRHSSKAMQNEYGISLLLEIVLGENSSQLEQMIAGVAKSLVDLKFSRSQEEESDEFSVKYLKTTSYDCAGAAGFFEKMLNDEDLQNNVPTFLSTHPSNESRVDDINAEAAEQGCSK